MQKEDLKLIAGRFFSNPTILVISHPNGGYNADLSSGISSIACSSGHTRSEMIL